MVDHDSPSNFDVYKNTLTGDVLKFVGRDSVGYTFDVCGEGRMVTVPPDAWERYRRNLEVVKAVE